MKWIAQCAIHFALLGSFFSCSGNNPQDADNSLRAAQCARVEAKYTFDEFGYDGSKGTGKIQFSEIRQGIQSACTSCHQAPANKGGFSFIDSFKAEERVVGGTTQIYPGYFEIAEKVAAYLLHSDPEKRMPPLERRSKNPDSFTNLGNKVTLWIAAGKPNGSFSLAPQAAPELPQRPKVRGSELGDCTPIAEIIGFDYQKDRAFAAMDRLPASLADTDLFSLDAYELAKKGTVAYNVEYPLWADNNNKGRFVHVPMKQVGLKLQKQSFKWVEGKPFFEVQENTRLYKNFYKQIKMANGKFRYRRIETRLIVVRKPWTASLFGSYKWDETEQSATLVDTPYRDGSLFKDTLFQVTVDEEKLKTRDYAIPGSQRCLDCHMGSENQSFVLGFTPLQLRRRPTSEGGREEGLSSAELSQVERLKAYGIISGAPPVSDWPVLEKAGTEPPRNEFELKAAGYMVGNCAHCHNPQGLAFSKENGVSLNLTAGAIFGFNTKIHSTQIPSRLIVHQGGDLDQSHIWRKISETSQQLGLTSQMPMNSAGGPDCKGLRAIGKWVRSLESEQAARAWEPTCKKENEFKWIDQDFTVVTSDFYIPRRPDWNDPKSGMPEKFRNLELTPELQKAISTETPVGYWAKKDICQFPPKDLSVEERRPWMMRGDKPKRPFGEIYYSLPGSWYYRSSCMKCHGANADGNSSLARGIMQWSGGSIRVADLIHGMFGNKGENLKTFDSAGKNFAPNYLFWMAMEGTQVQFPAELSSFVGKHGAQMLNQMREKCLNQISPEKASSPIFMDHEIFQKVCFVNNLEPGNPKLAFDPMTNKPLFPEAVEAWLDRATFNIGYSIYYFLNDRAQGISHPANDQCELIYAKQPM